MTIDFRPWGLRYRGAHDHFRALLQWDDDMAAMAAAAGCGYDDCLSASALGHPMDRADTPASTMADLIIEGSLSPDGAAMIEAKWPAVSKHIARKRANLAKIKRA